MQVMPFIGADLANAAGADWTRDQTLFDVESNIRIGSLHLFRQILEFESVEKGLVSYNRGETALRRTLRQNRPMPRRYLKKVITAYQELKEKYGDIS